MGGNRETGWAVRCAWVVAALAACVAAGCKSSGSGGGGGGSCGAFTACGGDVVGTWELEDMCLDADLDEVAGIDEPACRGAVGAVDVMPDATLTVTADTLTIDGGLSLAMQLTFTDSCVQALSGEPSARTSAAACSALQDGLNEPNDVIDSATCSFTGSACSCTAYSTTLDISESGAYRVEGNELVESGGGEPFCVQGDTLTVVSSGMGTTGIGGQLRFTRR